MDRYGSPTAAVSCGGQVWVGYDNGTIRIWDNLGHGLVHEINDDRPRIKRIASMQLMGEHVWAAGQAHGIYVYDIQTKERPRT